MQWRREAVLALRRGVMGALASGGARVIRACAAVRKGARAEAGWRRAPRARAEGFMGVRLGYGRGRRFATGELKAVLRCCVACDWALFTRIGVGCEPMRSSAARTERAAMSTVMS